MLVNRAKMTTATTGTGTITLGSAVDGYQTFAAAGVTDAAVVSYAIEDGTAWEIGTGTYTASGTTLSRTVSESSNAGAAINLSGNAVVFVTARAEDLATGGGDPTLATSSGATQSVDFSTSNKIHVATIDEDATLTFTNPASVARVELILDVEGSGYDLANGSYDDVSLDPAQALAPRDVFFGNLGTKMYVVNGNLDDVVQYTLTTPYDLSTAAYDSVSLSVASQTTNLEFGAISDSGDILYVCDSSSRIVYQYTVATAWDLSTASYASLSFDATSDLPSGSAIEGIAFKLDGSKMYLVGDSSAAQAVYQFTLTTPGDVSTAVYDSKLFSVGGQDVNPHGLQFSDDGLQMVVSGDVADSLHLYSLSTAWDVSTASYTGVSLDLSGQNSLAWGFAFSQSGDTVIVANNNILYQYTTGSVNSVTMPANLQSPAIPTAAGEKTALTIVTYDGGTTYQAINVQGGIA